MADQIHSGKGDNIGGDQTKIDRQINMPDGGSYVETQNIIQTNQKIDHFLSGQPFIPEVFQGRDTDLSAIRAKLTNRQTSQLLLLVNGEGGIGKTSLAARYWQRYHKEYRHVAWLFCSVSLQETLLFLANALQLVFPETLPGEERLERLLQKLANLPEPCLLVLDNANDPNELKRHYLALQALPNCHVLLTSRINHFEHAEQFKIEPLRVADALKVFITHYPKHKAEEDSLFHSIFNAVGGNTLVMEVLAKNLAVINADEMIYTLADLLIDLQLRGLLHLSQAETVTIAGKGRQAKLEDAKPQDILMSLYSDLEMVVPLTDYEQYLLSNLSVLPAERLSFSMLKDLLAPEDSKTFSKTLTGLAQRGWLDRFEKDGSAYYKISPVVQEITLNKNWEWLLQDCSALIAKLIEKLKYDPGTGHLLNVSYEEGALYYRFGDEVFNNLNDQGIVYDLSRLADGMGYFQKTTGNLEQAWKYFNHAYRIAQDYYENNNGDDFYQNVLAIYLARLGSVAFSLGNLDQALGYFEDYHRLEKQLYDADPGNVEFKNNLAISYERLGTTHKVLGNLDQVLGNFECYQQLEKELYEAYPSNVGFKNNWAISYVKLGVILLEQDNLDKALGYFEEHNRLEKKLHESYPGNVEFKNNLALAYQWLGWAHEQMKNLDKAADNYRQSKLLLEQLSSVSTNHIGFKKNLEWVNNRLNVLNTTT